MVGAVALPLDHSDWPVAGPISSMSPFHLGAADWGGGGAHEGGHWPSQGPGPAMRALFDPQGRVLTPQWLS